MRATHQLRLFSCLAAAAAAAACGPRRAGADGAEGLTMATSPVGAANECLDLTDNCDPSAYCIDTARGFRCECPPGFDGDGTHCEPRGAAVAGYSGRPGAMRVHFNGEPRLMYSVEATASLNSPSSWSVLQTQVADATGAFDFQEAGPAAAQSRFFRAPLHRSAQCSSDADCRLVADYRTGCDCRAMSAQDPGPSCAGAHCTACLTDPCIGASALCDPQLGRCITD